MSAQDQGAECYRRFLMGSDDAFAELVRIYRDGLILYLNRFTADLTVAEDLAEDTFVRLVTKKPRFSGRSSFRTFLYAIGRHIAADFMRKRKEVCPMEGNEALFREELDLAAECLKKERSRQVHEALGRLSLSYRQILWLIYFEDFTLREAAEVMKRTVHGTEALAYRARKALREQLMKEGFTYEDL